jgi:diacylglycerol kinase (ATP)
MRIMLLYNPISGSGRAQRAAEALASDLREAGHETVLERTERNPAADWLVDSLAEVDLLVVVGGDGAVRLASDPAARDGTPLYPFPLGTENLFAREFGIRRSTRQLLDALRRFDVRRVDMGVVGDQTFLLMTSMGFDASVVQHLASRSGGIRQLTYIRPFLCEVRRWRPSALTIRVDGECVVENQTGFVVIANSRQYAIRLDPALRASMTDGALDVAFFPCASSLTALARMIASRFRLHVRSARLTYRKGSRVVVHSDPEHPYQLDGDPPEPTSPASELSVAVRCAAGAGSLSGPAGLQSPTSAPARARRASSRPKPSGSTHGTSFARPDQGARREPGGPHAPRRVRTDRLLSTVHPRRVHAALLHAALLHPDEVPATALQPAVRDQGQRADHGLRGGL